MPLGDLGRRKVEGLGLEQGEPGGQQVFSGLLRKCQQRNARRSLSFIHSKMHILSNILMSLKSERIFTINPILKQYRS